MSRSRHSKRRDNKEYWKPREPTMSTPGRITKDITKAKERMADKHLERDAMTLLDADVAASDGPKRSPCRPR